jgi:serine/threonine-protein kinase
MTAKVCTKCHAELTGDFTRCPYDGAELELPPEDKLIGTVFADRYEIVSVLGKGGMSVVYKARHKLMNRTVAIKLLHSHLVSDANAITRFQQEAQAASSLQHPNVITVYDFGLINGNQAFLVMDCLEGTNLADILEKEGRLQPERAVKIFRQVCEGLDEAHRKGIIHRDLKPSNLCIIKTETGKELVKIVDFGIAKLLPQEGKQRQQLTQTGEIFGSPLFMSPEQCTGRILDPRSDIYSLGCVMYEALCGSPPLMGETAFDTMTMHVNNEPVALRKVAPDAHIPDQLETIVMRCLEKEPEHRYQSVSQLLQDLPTVKEDTGSLKVSAIEPRRRRKKSLVSVAAFRIGVVVVLILLSIFAYAGLNPGPENDRGTALQKLRWNIQMSLAEQATNSKHYQVAEHLLEEAEKISRSFGDNRSRLLQTIELKRKLFERANMFEEQEKATQEINMLQDERLLQQYNVLIEKVSSLGVEDKGIAKSVKKLDAEGLLPMVVRMSGLLGGSGFWSQDENLLNTGIEVYSKLLGANSVAVAKFDVLLADCYKNEQRTREVRPLLTSAVKIFDSTKGQNDRESIEALMKLGIFEKDQSHFEAAKGELSTAMERAKKYHPAEPKFVSDAINAMADYYMQLGDQHRATELFDEAKVWRRSAGNATGKPASGIERDDI